MRFTKLQDIPSEYRALINLLIEKGIIVVTNDEFEYPLSLDQLYLNVHFLFQKFRLPR